MKEIKQNELDEKVRNEYSNLNGIIVWKDEKIVVENYYNSHTSESSCHVASLTKSISSILVGIALDKGYISSIDTTISSYLEDYKAKGDQLSRISIKDILTMQVKYKYKYEPYTKVYSSEDWTETVIKLLGEYSDDKEFRYSTVGVQLLGSIILKATGKSMLDFGDEVLFRPLGITTPKLFPITNKDDFMTIVKGDVKRVWASDPSGIPAVGWGLCLSTRDLLKIGLLYLNDGNYNGQQILSKQYIQESIEHQSTWVERSLNYGYLWWNLGDSCFAAIGDGGNLIYVDIKNNIVVAITAGFKPRAKDIVAFVENEIIKEIMDC